MPKSTVRKKKVYTPPAEMRPQATAAARKPSPTWLPATAVGLIIFAIVWLVVYYLTGQFFDLEIEFDHLSLYHLFRTTCLAFHCHLLILVKFLGPPAAVSSLIRRTSGKNRHPPRSAYPPFQTGMFAESSVRSIVVSNPSAEDKRQIIAQFVYLRFMRISVS